MAARQPDFPRRIRARHMGAVINAAENIKQDEKLAERVRRIVAECREAERKLKEGPKP